jgi:hypothetical protein
MLQIYFPVLSLIRRKKFPDSFWRQDRVDALWPAWDTGIRAVGCRPAPPKSRFFSVIFPVSREFEPETSSLQTATTATVPTGSTNLQDLYSEVAERSTRMREQHPTSPHFILLLSVRRRAPVTIPGRAEPQSVPGVSDHGETYSSCERATGKLTDRQVKRAFRKTIRDVLRRSNLNAGEYSQRQHAEEA